MITLTAKGVAKAYGATQALGGLDMRITSGFVTGLAGPNGAGKSTLTRILAGEELPDRGEIRFERVGATRNAPCPKVAVVHQEPQLWPNLTVLENLAVGRELVSTSGVRPPAHAMAILNALGIDRFSEFQLSDLSLATQQRVEIARAVMSDADVFLFDEPNSALTDHEFEALFTTMASLAHGGKIVVLITHRLNDFVRCCRRVLILRDGRIAGELHGASLSEAAIATALTTDAHFVSSADSPQATAGVAVSAPTSGTAILRLTQLTDRSGRFRHISLNIEAGRILALAGVEGSGAREVVRTIGLDLGDRTRSDARFEANKRIAFVAASRQQSIFPNLTVGENLVSRLGWALLSRPLPFLRGSLVGSRGAAGIVKYRVKARSHLDLVIALSGGNQQKVAVGAALEQDPDILVMEEPTRGVDVASKREIYSLLRAAADSGKAIVLLCTEVPEMFAVADRIAVMSRGHLVRIIEVGQVPSVTALANILAEYEAAGSIGSSRREAAMSQ